MEGDPVQREAQGGDGGVLEASLRHAHVAPAPPKVIVEHYTDGTTFSGAWNTFAANSRHDGELPGTCAHFIVDRDGTIINSCRSAFGAATRSG